MRGLDRDGEHGWEALLGSRAQAQRDCCVSWKVRWDTVWHCQEGGQQIPQ